VIFWIIGIWVLIAIAMGIWSFFDDDVEGQNDWRDFFYGFRFTIGLPFAIIAGVGFMIYRTFMWIAETIHNE